MDVPEESASSWHLRGANTEDRGSRGPTMLQHVDSLTRSLCNKSDDDFGQAGGMWTLDPIRSTFRDTLDRGRLPLSLSGSCAIQQADADGDEEPTRRHESIALLLPTCSQTISQWIATGIAAWSSSRSSPAGFARASR